MHDTADHIKLPAHVLIVDVSQYLTIDTVFSLVDYLQYYAEILASSAHPDLLLCAQLNKLIVQLAHLGSMQASSGALQELNKDVITLLSESAPSRTLQFIRKHKKAMTIGIAAAAAVDTAAPSLITQPHTPPPLTILHTHHEKTLCEETKTAGAQIAHKIWDDIADASTGLLQCITAITPSDTRMQHDPHIQSTWQRDIIYPGHEKIDAWFHEYVVHSASLNSLGEHSLIYGFVPPPISLLHEIEEIIHLAQTTGVDTWTPFIETFAARHYQPIPLPPIESIAAQEPPPPFQHCIEPPVQLAANEAPTPPFQGREIRHFDTEKMMQDNRVNHLFGKSAVQLDRLGMTPEEAYASITQAVLDADKAGHITADHPFKVRIKINGCQIEARGVVINGELRYSSLFFPKN